MRVGTVWSIRGTSVLGVAAFLSACGGATPAAAPAPAPSAEIPVVRTDTEPGQIVGPMVFGVDLDTVTAGTFDQGKMWTFEFPPTEYLEATYGLRPDAAWFEKARLGSLRIPSCSASFVSPNGLVMTNHHCAREFVTQVQREGETLLDDGFLATNLADERDVTDFEADQLIDIVDVTDEVNERVDQVPMQERAGAREELLDEIKERILAEKGGADAGFEVEMISLYNGGRTSAYVFRRYTHAKLVMAPEVQIGFFGGDPDNFTYPRYNLDFSFFRIYDDEGNPLQSDVYFKVDDEGLQEGDPIFIIGNPGSTSRLQTVAELEFRRDVSDRYVVDLLRSRMGALDAFIRAHPEEAEARDLRNSYFGLSNSEKAYGGQVRGLEDPVIMARRRDTDRRFQAAIDADPALEERYGDLIARMAELQDAKREQAAGFGAFLAMTSDEMESATLYRALVAFQILNARMGGSPPEQVDELMDELKGVPQQHPDLNTALMAARFQDFVDRFGADSPIAQNVLGGRTPMEAAAAVVAGSQLADSAGAVAAMEAGSVDITDPALGVVRAYLPQFIEFQQMVGAIFPEEEEIAAELGRARFEVYGTDVPPDATFSLRIADGVVQGYDYNGTEAPWHTTLYGFYDRHFSFPGREEWALPPRWVTPPAGLDLSTPMNFVSTADIIGGNSGSPVLDQELEVVGLVFDGNIESLPGDYIYLPELNRTVAVDIRAILEALDDVYDMDRLVLELTTGRLAETEVEADRVRR
ncbi:MAG TPA: S46 family peptidase [Longimicrobiales bacterium]|nr:S46 family peptidase [Longimicrobiales bacterium]